MAALKLKTAGIIIIGDEILSGKVEDCNAIFMIRELRNHGVDVRRISVIPDDIEVISGEVKKFSHTFDYVFTSGGIGPTHDDVTIEAVSRAYDVNVSINNDLKKILYEKYGDDLTPERLKMAEVPDGAELIKDKTLKFPLILFKNIYIFPGIPQYLRQKFHVIAKEFDKVPILLKKVYIDEYESEIAPFLNIIVENNRDVKIGSYPIIDSDDFSVLITFESMDNNKLDTAVHEFVKSIPKEKIIKTE